MNHCNLGRNLFIFYPQIRYLGLNLVHQTKKKKKKKKKKKLFFFEKKKKLNTGACFIFSFKCCLF